MGGGGDAETFVIIGAAMEVHKELGEGFLEAVYQEALALELESRGVPFVRESELRILYKTKPLEARYRADFVCFGSVIVELKALPKLSGFEEAQILNYLKATGLDRGLLLNFGKPSLEFKRFAYDRKRKMRIDGTNDEEYSIFSSTS